MSLINEFKDLLLTTKQFIEQEWPHHKIAIPANFVQPQKNPSSASMVHPKVPQVQSTVNENLAQKEEEKKYLQDSKISAETTHSDSKGNKSVATSEKVSSFTLEPLAKAVEDSFSDVKKSIQNLFPNLVHFNETLSDAKVIEIKSKWKFKSLDDRGVLISFEEGVAQKEFLSNVARALTMHGVSFVVLDSTALEKKGWEKIFEDSSIKYIIAPLNALKRLCPSEAIKMSTQKGQFFFLQIPGIEILEATNYLNDINLKAELWKSLRNYLNI